MSTQSPTKYAIYSAVAAFLSSGYAILPFLNKAILSPDAYVHFEQYYSSLITISSLIQYSLPGYFSILTLKCLDTNREYTSNILTFVVSLVLSAVFLYRLPIAIPLLLYTLLTYIRNLAYGCAQSKLLLNLLITYDVIIHTSGYVIYACMFKNLPLEWVVIALFIPNLFYLKFLSRYRFEKIRLLNIVKTIAGSGVVFSESWLIVLLTNFERVNISQNCLSEDIFASRVASAVFTAFSILSSYFFNYIVLHHSRGVKKYFIIFYIGIFVAFIGCALFLPNSFLWTKLQVMTCFLSAQICFAFAYARLRFKYPKRLALSATLLLIYLMWAKYSELSSYVESLVNLRMYLIASVFIFFIIVFYMDRRDPLPVGAAS